MKTENLYCDCCKKKTTDEGIKKESLNGFFIEAGYSTGGWGSRKDWIARTTIEVCDECFGTIKNKVQEMKDTIKTLTK